MDKIQMILIIAFILIFIFIYVTKIVFNYIFSKKIENKYRLDEANYFVVDYHRITGKGRIHFRLPKKCLLFIIDDKIIFTKMKNYYFTSQFPLILDYSNQELNIFVKKNYFIIAFPHNNEITITPKIEDFDYINTSFQKIKNK